jgi:hypothetical protein
MTGQLTRHKLRPEGHFRRNKTSHMRGTPRPVTFERNAERPVSVADVLAKSVSGAHRHLGAGAPRFAYSRSGSAPDGAPDDRGATPSQSRPSAPQITRATTAAFQPEYFPRSGVTIGASNPMPLPPVFKTALADPSVDGVVVHGAGEGTCGGNSSSVPE